MDTDLRADAPPAGQPPPPVRARRTRALALVLALWLGYFAAFVVLTWAIRRRQGVATVLAAVVLAGCLLAADQVMRASRRSEPGARWRAQLVLVLLGTGALVLVAWAGGRTDGWGLLGASLCVVAGGQWTAELRSSHHVGGWASLAVVASGLALVGVGQWWNPWEAPGWPGTVLVAVGIGGTAAGLGLLSEHVLVRATAPRADGDRPPVWTRWTVGVLVGGGIAVAAAWWLQPLQRGTLYPVLAVLALFVLVGAVASNTSSDVLIVVLAAALLWALLPRGAALDATVTPTAGAPTLVAFGDSFMSGEGAKRYYEGTNTRGVNECRRATTAYPVVAARRGDPAVPGRVIFVACSGARTADIAGHVQYAGDPADVPGGLDQLDNLAHVRGDDPAAGPDVRLALVSVGGNDAGFGDIVQTCIGPGNCAELGAEWLSRLPRAGAQIDHALAAIRATLGTSVPVVVVPYPVPLTARSCPASLLLPAEHRFLAGFAHQLDLVVRDAAARAGVYYLAEMEDAFVPGPLALRGLRLCDQRARAIGVHTLSANPVEGLLEERSNPITWFHNSFHPNAAGHRAMAATLITWLHAHPHLAPTGPPAGPVPGHDVASIGEIMGGSDVDYCHVGLADCGGSVGAWSHRHWRDLGRRTLMPLVLALAGSAAVWLFLLRARRLWAAAPRHPGFWRP